MASRLHPPREHTASEVELGQTQGIGREDEEQKAQLLEGTRTSSLWPEEETGSFSLRQPTSSSRPLQHSVEVVQQAASQLTEELRARLSWAVSRGRTEGGLLLVVLLVLLFAVIVTGFLVVSQRKVQLGLVACPANVTGIPVPRIQDMSLLEKAGQMALVSLQQLGANAGGVTSLFLGGVASGAGAWPAKATPAARLAAVADTFQAAALQTRLRIPIISAVQAVHGHGALLNATIFPHNIALGATRNPHLVATVAAAVAQEIAATGARWALGPSLCVCTDPRWGRCFECFSEDPAIVANLTTAVGGLQAPLMQGGGGEASSASLGVAATATDYMGAVMPPFGVEEGDVELDEAALRQRYLGPFSVAVAGGATSQAAAVMVWRGRWNGEPEHSSQRLIEEILKQELGFKGVVLSGWGGVETIPGVSYWQQIRTAVNAGVDMVAVGGDGDQSYGEFVAALVRDVKRGFIPEARVDDAVQRILELKQKLGLFDRPCADPGLLASVGSAEHREISRQAVRESLVLLKDGGGDRRKMFPLPVEGTIWVGGSASNDVGQQCGGFTVTWQGGPIDSPQGTIVAGIQEAVGNHVTVIAAERWADGTVADIAILVVGEEPYAGHEGDDDFLELPDGDLEAINTVCSRLACVVVLITGRPVAIQPWISAVDAVVAAWLPGTEGGRGISDVLFGDHDFVGRLPISWFRTIDQLPLDRSHSSYDPLFPIGWGLNKAGKPL